MILFSRGTIAGCVAAATLGLFVAGSVTPASAQWRDHGDGWGAPVAVGLIGGLALGAIAGSAAQGPVYAPAPVYVPEPGPAYAPPVVYDEPVEQAPACWNQRRPVYDYSGEIVGYRAVRLCR